MKYLLLDVAGTILFKPELIRSIHSVLIRHGFAIDIERVRYHHKLLSEVVKFPDRTSRDFYLSFNSELLYSLGIIPFKDLLEDIFQTCSYLPWEKYEDTSVLQKLNVPIGILSNFNGTLKDKLNARFGNIFSDVFVSEELGVSKPSLEFYQNALNIIGISPADILYVGDSPKLDLMPALEVGLNAYVVDREGFYANNTRTLRSLNEIKGLL